MERSGKEQNVVVFGGGTGLSNLLRGLKKDPAIHLTAIVTVADDGGSSGRLLQQYDIPPPGDIRQVMGALSEAGPLVDRMFQYRFKGEEGLHGHTLGNLMLAALTDVTGDFANAIERLSSLFNVKGTVLPVANERLTLHAELEDGTIVTGESKIPVYGTSIQRVYVSPQEVEPLPAAIEAVEQADYILIGPGSLYTSILPTLLVEEMRRAIIKSTSPKVYISNLTTQIGETTSYTASDHVKALYSHVGQPFLDTVVIHEPMDAIVHEQMVQCLQQKGDRFVDNDVDELERYGVNVWKENIATEREGRIVHDTDRIAQWFSSFTSR